MAERIHSSRPVILHLLHSLHVGGAEILAARLARRLGGEFRSLFVCLDAIGSLGRDLRDEGFTVEVVERKSGVDWNLPRRLARLLRREQVSVIHAHQYTPFFYATLARLLHRRPRILFTEHGRHHPDYARRKRMLANRILLERRDRVVAVGGAVRLALVENEGFNPRRVAVIHNGIDLQTSAKPGSARLAVRHELGIRNDDFVAVQVARLDYLKDHATSIRTMARVVEQRPEVRLLLIGEGPEQGAIEQFVHQHALGASVRFLGLRTDVAHLLAAADLFLLTSISEGIPLTILEAMAAGLPVVATRAGGVSEIVEDGRTGLLAPVGDDTGLSQHVLRLAGEPDVRTEMGRLGRERVEQFFSEDRMHARYRELYREMLAE